MKKLGKYAKYKIGLDEVGRGPIAGPITVGCVALPNTYTWAYFKKLEKKGVVPTLRDSKKLTAKQREVWYEWVTAQREIVWSVASISAQQIDTVGIVGAGNRAADTVYVKVLSTMSPGLRSNKNLIVSLDKGLCLKNCRQQKSYVKGDEQFVEIALASILAKVTRDRYMQAVDKKYKMYGFAANKGYGSKAHYVALHSHGLSKVHRRSFIHL